MKSSQDRMTIYHSGSCIPHRGLYLFSHGRFVAMDSAIGTGCFGSLKRTFRETPRCIIKKPPAFNAKSGAGFVPAVTVNTYHGVDSPSFSVCSVSI